MPSLTNTYVNDGGGGRGTGFDYSYDPKTGSWIPTPPNSSSAPDFEELFGDSSDEDKVPSEFTGSDSLTQVDSKGEAEKEYIEIEFNTLTGELNVTPSKKAIRIKASDTVEVLGIGKYLSGKYFVSGVKRTISKDDGYSQTLTVLKNGFGDSLKQIGSSSPSKSYSYSADSLSSAPTSAPTGAVDRVEKVEKSATAFSEGDSVKIVGNAIYSNAHEGVKVPAWVKEQILTVRQISTDGTRVLLMPINSWTYTTFVQKV